MKLLALIFMLAASAHAARLVDFTISLDGHVVMESVGFDSGEQPPREVWTYLQNRLFKPKPGFTVPADAGNPLQATLRGRIRIGTRYGGFADVPSLQLFRDDPAKNAWRLAPAEVAATAAFRRDRE
jgi:hypothetical protein